MKLEDEIRYDYLFKEHGHLIDQVKFLEDLLCNPYLKEYREVFGHLKSANDALSRVLDKIEEQMSELRGRREIQ